MYYFIDDLVEKEKNDSAKVYFYSEVKPLEEGNFWYFVEGMPTIW